MINQPNSPASKQQTFALYCATAKDYRLHNLTRERASQLLQAVQHLRGDKAAARAVVDSMLGSTGTIPDTTTPTVVLVSKESQFDSIWNEAQNAGREAAHKCDVVPMVVGSPKHFMSNELDTTKPMEYVSDGVCGFAWVNVKPGTSSFAKWLVKNNYARKDSYYGGVCVWIGDYNQSMQRKEAHASAMASVFVKHGIKAYMGSRMD